MDFTSAQSLLTLWILPLLALLLWYAARTEQKRRRLFLDTTMAERLFPNRSVSRTLVRAIALLTAFAFGALALAGPRFGVYFEKVSRKGADIMVVLDTSRSMSAEDLAPNRLEAAKLDIEDLLSVVSGDRVGLIAFAGKPILQVPLTDDFGFYRQTLKKIDTRAAPRGGTAIGDAIRLALRSMKPDAGRDQAILLITDGEDHESMPLEAAADAAQRGVRIFTVALGDMNEGARIPLFDQNGKRTGFEMYQGQEVWSKPDSALLEKIASNTGGAFLGVGNGPCDLGAFYSDALAALNRSDYGEHEKRQLHEKYQVFLALALIAFACRFCIAPNGRNLLDDSWAESSALSPGEKGTKFGRFFRRAAPVFLTLALINAPVAAQEDLSSKALYNEACQKMNVPESAAEAARLFEEAIQKNDNDAITASAAFNLALLTCRQIAAETAALDNAPDEATAPNANDTTVSAPGDDAAAPAPPQSAVEQYRAEAAKRQEARKPVREKTLAADTLFRESAALGNRTLKKESAQNLDLLRSWSQGQRNRWLAAERAARAETFAPQDHLEWLASETERRLENKALEREPAELADYQRLFDEAELISSLADDLDGALANTIFDSNDENGLPATVHKESLEQARAALNDAAAVALRFDSNSTKQSLQTAAEQIDTVRIDGFDYPTALGDAIWRQEKIVEQAKAIAPDSPDTERSEQGEPLLWRDDFTSRRAERLIAEARREFDARPWSESEAEPDDSAAPHAENTPSAPPTPTAPSPEDAQKKLRRSMKLALDLGPEIVTILKDVEEKIAPDDSAALVDSETKALELLREIQKPLQDENQNQQQQQNQQQDQQQQQQNQQDQQQDQHQDQSQNQQDQQQSSDEQQEASESKENKPEDPDERQAESTMRKVRQRQQSAEEMRKMRDEYLRRTEKPEKDW